MKIDRLLIITGLLILTIVLGGCNLPLFEGQDPEPRETELTFPTETAEPVTPEEEVQPSPTEEINEQSGTTLRSITFDQLGITLMVPSELVIQKDPLVNYDDPARLDGYLFYIQNYGDPAGPNTGDFQIYGILQYNLPPITWEVFSENTLNSTMNAYATEIEVNGLRGFDTQLTGQRNRYVYHFLLNGQVLSLAVAEPTEENKALADQIISTLEYDPAKFTDASGMQKVVDPDLNYQMYIPDDWTYSFEPAAGVRISALISQSSDAELIIEDTDGPHSNFLYKSGMFMELVIQEGDEIFMEPVMAEVIRSSEIMIAGIPMSDFVFREPSTVEGEIRELRFYHNNLNYRLRFSYAPDADRLLIDWILLNLEIFQDD